MFGLRRSIQEAAKILDRAKDSLEITWIRYENRDLTVLQLFCKRLELR
jgi:hypothetical protein